MLTTRFTGTVTLLSGVLSLCGIRSPLMQVFSSDNTVVDEEHIRRSHTPSVKSERTSSESSGMVAAYWTPQESPGRREPENHKMVVHSIPVQLASPVNTLQRALVSPGNSFATP